MNVVDDPPTRVYPLKTRCWTCPACRGKHRPHNKIIGLCTLAEKETDEEDEIEGAVTYGCRVGPEPFIENARALEERPKEQWEAKEDAILSEFQPRSEEESEEFAPTTQHVDATTARLIFRMAAWWRWGLGLIKVEAVYLDAKMERQEKIEIKKPKEKERTRNWLI